MPMLTVDISDSLMNALTARRARTGESNAHIVMTALADALEVDHATLFQVSTSSALTEGVYQGAVTIGDLKQNGDFGLGTFEDLDGELIALDGHFYRVDATGAAGEAPNEAIVPFSVVTDFPAQLPFNIDRATSFGDLYVPARPEAGVAKPVLCGAHRRALRQRQGPRVLQDEQRRVASRGVGGAGRVHFHRRRWYARRVLDPNLCRRDQRRRLAFARRDDDRRQGGHVLDVQGTGLQTQLAELADVRIAIPETAEFLRADLSQ